MGTCGAKQPQPHLPEIPGGTNQATVIDCQPDDSASPKQRSDVRRGTLSGSQFILSNPGKVHDVYSMEDKKIGEGTYGSVVRGTHKVTKKVRAIKIISKGQMKNVDRFKREIDSMKILTHPNIVKLFETFEDNRSVFLAMELCSGGELFDRIIEAGHLTEREAAIVVQQILRATFYMHDKKISHRDLKPENFLFVNKDPLDRSLLKIIDFGLSCHFKDGQVLSTRAGTPYYVAPQVLSGKYDHMCDLWSVGVITYILLCGYPPFYGRNDQEVLSKVRKGNFSFEEKDWGRISGDAKSLIRSLLHQNPRERFTAAQALNHEWIRQTAPRASASPLRSNPALVENLRGFRSQNKLKKAALQIIAGQLDESQIKNLREIFTELDVDGDGQITRDELEQGLSKAGYSGTKAELLTIVEGMDTDQSGLIDYTEFLAASLPLQTLSVEACTIAFKVFDRDDDGKITLDELRQVLENDGAVRNLTGADEHTVNLLRSVDNNGDGHIDFQEFMTMMKSQVTNDRPSPKSATSPARGALRGGA